MTKPWLTGLSDEWISEPTPNGSVRSADDPAAQISQSVPPKARSRLPRLRQSSGSFSEIQVRHIAKDLRPPKPRSALAERSHNDNNVQPVRSPEAPEVTSSRCASQSFADSTPGSLLYDGTVAHKPTSESPEKDYPLHNTPEWRKRLLKGDIGYGDQKDLFSPMGLENIFQKPREGDSEEARPRKSKLGMFRGLSNMPSSPPPWPATETDHQAQRGSGTEGERPSLLIQNRGDGLPTDKAQTIGNPSTDIDTNESSSNSVLRFDGNWEGQRTISGQIEYENENFSPVYLSTNLKIGAPAALIPDFTGSDLAHRLRHIGSPPPTLEHHPLAEDDLFSQGLSRNGSSFTRLQDDTLPEDLPAGTPELADVGRFVELRRGGYSRDGSFRTRPLSPSLQTKTRRREPTENGTGVQDERERGSQDDKPDDSETNERDAPKSPITPRRRGQKSAFLSPSRATGSGSPLKLFDAHDTFTSNRLQRRLSQLEYKSEQVVGTNYEEETNKIVQKTSRLTSVEEASAQKVTVRRESVPPGEGRNEARRIGTFGQGQLDGYSFPEEFSTLSSPNSLAQESCPEDSPSIDAMPPGSHQPLRFAFDGSPQSRKSSRLLRQGLTRVSNPFRSRSVSKSLSFQVSYSSTQPEAAHEPQYAEGKRGPTSPFKNPTPKRRRTFDHDGEQELAVGESGFTSTKETHTAMQSVITRKRKDARHDHSVNIADPDVLARRAILRPRNPTPSQRRRDEIHAEILEATDAFILSSPKLNTIREQLDSPSGSNAISEERRAVAVANEVAAFSMKRVDVMKDQSRKRSVTTQDFLDEAVKIMDYIRTKGRPTSGLGSLEETESEDPIDEYADALPSTPLTFSRPPSREGRMSEWREPRRHQVDPDMMSHLRKFQEKESDGVMGSSIHSLRFSRLKEAISPENPSIIVEQNNIRITDNTARDETDTSGEENAVDSQSKTQGTLPSTGSSLGQTIATSASRRSDHVATLAPEAVAHLIPEQIAGMSFDREKNIWVRQKSPSKEHLPREDISSTNESEEDPFGNIPDLTVDECAGVPESEESPVRPQATAETFVEDSGADGHPDRMRPDTRDGKAIPPADTSSVPSKVSNFAWSFPKTETRATSWSDQETRNLGTQKIHRLQTTYSIPESDEVDIEHEIQYFEGRGTVTPPGSKAKMRDITFSIEQQDIQTQAHTFTRRSSPRHKKFPGWTQPVTQKPSRVQNATWQQLTGARTLPHSRLPDLTNDADASILEPLPSRSYRMQVSMNVAAPVLKARDNRNTLAAPSSPVKADVTFMLSDLPEFTLDQVDECELPNRVIVKHDGLRFSKALEDRYAQGTADLIKALQDVVPDEPYWEDIREVNLCDRGLTNLHRLDEFCCRLEELNVSGNGISQVNGIPYSVRRLRAPGNCLTGLTSWSTLMNLQHLDISANDIDSLDGLSDLMHLRTLKLDNNKVTSLEGILHLDGLQELSANGNDIEYIDFARSELKSLTELNLRGNRLRQIRNVHLLSRLQNLDLDDNCLKRFPEFDQPAARCLTLNSLRLNRNRLVSLNLETSFPNLQCLFTDGNSLSEVHGLEHLRHLRTFSAREQSLGNTHHLGMCVGNLFVNSDVRNLHLSVNPTPVLGISQHLLNLQCLELASMGLKTLPDDFGQLAPNIRSINLNFNSIKDLRPLLNIKRLDELLIAGNKLARLRTNLAVLGRLNTLSKVDLRENPLTLRFYPPSSENRIVTLKQKPSEETCLARFVLPAGDLEADHQYLQRLDFETRIRRRVQEIMFSTQCGNLRELDGLPFDKARILKKDDIWERLSYLGVIRRTETSEPDVI
ncbi:hypothetical protein K491DRAFT_691941 [Lophiostoma macrostomum CBS 122681]|uniref:L domain-like protein n=1 Tax=Lophiostoma macrostomum CBS 122681 TaxID=1314788 RepID=A0A6A6TCE2_9PLEO|nr:hypothetical protein K491DRAFT_691941 [Lophiostoma macrostomum CBS 122681]